MTCALTRLGVIVLAALCAAGCDRTWRCFTVESVTSPPPHSGMNDQFCVVQRWPTGSWALRPGTGMEDWRAIGGGGSRIPMQLTTDTPTVKVWEFGVEVDNHPSGSGHDAAHQEPDLGYVLQVNILGEKAEAEISVGESGNPVHGGTAHANEN